MPLKRSDLTPEGTPRDISPSEPPPLPPLPPPGPEPESTVPLYAALRNTAIPALDFSSLPPRQDLQVPAIPPVRPAAVGVTPPSEEEGVTLAFHPTPQQKAPLVGWLVATDGPDSSKDFHLHPGRNHLGRGDKHDIRLADPFVSRERVATLTYDPRGNLFKLAPGDGNGLVYLNGETLDVPTVLSAMDKIEVGKSTLFFVPFCGPAFQWPASE